jgi:carboxyl-terminal processing protease
MRRTAGIAGVALLLLGAFALGLGATKAHDLGADSLRAGPRDAPLLPIDQVRSELVARYYRIVPPEILARESIDDMLSGLDDPYTDYLPRAEYASFRRRTAESYAGVGLTVEPGKGGLIVKSAIDGPARAAGILPGDRIVSIDGHRVRRLHFDRTLDLIEGREGTTVRLTIRRPREGTLSFTVRRKEIQLPAVRSRIVATQGGRVGYVRVITFRTNAAQAVSNRVGALLRRGAAGIVLDLRDNPGGLLSQAVRTVSLFVDDGIVCVTEGVNRGRREYEVAGNARFPRVPLVVLVDTGSASAAEVVAAALDDHGRASIVGLPTYGKASVQSVRELSNGAALKLTTAVFLTPTGANLTGRGLSPDVRAADLPRTRRDEALARAATVLLQQLAG